METDLSRSCADLKGVGGWVGGGWWKIQIFYSSDHHMANINTPPRKKKILDPRMIVCIFFPTMMQCMANVPQILYMHPNSNGSLH